MTSKLEYLSNVIEKSVAEMVRRDLIPKKEYLRLISIYDEYEVGKLYKADDTFRYEDELYEVIHEHTSSAEWAPDESLAIYKRITINEVIDSWVAPSGLHNAYHKGYKVIYEGEIWESIVNSNTWEPNVYGWVIV